MAKSAHIKKSAAKSSSLVAQSLVDIQINVDAEPDGEKIELRYNVGLDEPAQLSEGEYYFTCHLLVGKRGAGEEKDFARVEATYACMLKLTGEADNVASIAKKYVSTSVWGTFTGLFGIVSHQMRTQFPPLPPSPGKVELTGDTSLAPSDSSDDTSGSEQPS